MQIKKWVLSLLCSALLFSYVGAQQQKNTMSLTITRLGVTKTYPVSSLTYDFNKLNRDSSSIDHMPFAVMVGCERLDKFLLQSASGDTSNMLAIVITCYNKLREKVKIIAMENAVITQVSESFGVDNEANASTLDIYAHNLTVDGVKM